MRKKMTRKSLFGNRAVYVAMMDIRMDIVVTRAAYRRPHDNLLHIHSFLQVIFTQNET